MRFKLVLASFLLGVSSNVMSTMKELYENFIVEKNPIVSHVQTPTLSRQHHSSSDFLKPDMLEVEKQSLKESLKKIENRRLGKILWQYTKLAIDELKNINEKKEKESFLTYLKYILTCMICPPSDDMKSDLENILEDLKDKGLQDSALNDLGETALTYLISQEVPVENTDSEPEPTTEREIPGTLLYDIRSGRPLKKVPKGSVLEKPLAPLDDRDSLLTQIKTPPVLKPTIPNQKQPQKLNLGGALAGVINTEDLQNNRLKKLDLKTIKYKDDPQGAYRRNLEGGFEGNKDAKTEQAQKGLKGVFTPDFIKRVQETADIKDHNLRLQMSPPAEEEWENSSSEEDE